MAPTESLDFWVRRDDLRQCRFAPAPSPESVTLEPGQVLLRVAKFAFTANNVTYGVVGEALSYWSFFPAPEGWGRIPVWGFGDVLRSAHPEVREGERLFGYLPMSSHLVIQAAEVTPGALQDASPHRAALSPVYNRYTRVSHDPAYDERYEDQQMLFWPLFMTAFMLDDYFVEHDYFGAEQALLSSASSKTALGLAFLWSERAPFEVIGLTSEAHLGFVKGLGCYGRVVSYDAIETLPAERISAFVDMAGNGRVLARVHRHFADRLRESCLVGVTHWEHGERAPDLPGPTPSFFFAPTQIEKRARDWGPTGLAERFGEAWRPFRETARGWLRTVHAEGPEAVERIYRDTLEGRARPEEGYVLSL